MREANRTADESRVRDGVGTALPLVLPTLALGISFGVLAEPVMGAVAPIVMSVVLTRGRHSLRR